MVEALKNLFGVMFGVVADAAQFIIDGITLIWSYFVDLAVDVWNVFIASVDVLTQYLYDVALDYIENLWTEIWVQLRIYFGALRNWAQNVAVSHGFDLEGQITDLTTGFVDFAALYTAANWLFPIYACMGIMAGAYIAAATVRGVRWIISFIPWDFGG